MPRPLRWGSCRTASHSRPSPLAPRRSPSGGCYVPSRGPRERHNEDKRAFQAAVTDALPALAERGHLVVIAGDLNVIEPDHNPPHRGVYGAWEYDFYTSFAEAGFTDAFRALHPDAVEHSWFGRRSGDGYRFDHALVTSAHRAQVRTCTYLHEPREAGLSDHSALQLAIDLTGEPSP
ncbi:endonuclease/exonuclease/phosphatase family protein [Kitasatospora sp. NPDC004799]|uniref:endonuclease/exonuclease/phosphatase family protein n=1 Tax=Kitasatospora sp. NPDC004799 TaxID=3154460 RepID=UPI0033B89AFE